jgi:hypothetical protein
LKGEAPSDLIGGTETGCRNAKPLAEMEGVMNAWSNAKLCDVANLTLGVILFFSPWIFGLGTTGVAATNAYIVGIVIVVLSIAGLAKFAIWEEWLNLIAGLWLIVSPWVLGFSGSRAMDVDVVIGIIVAVLAAIELWLMYQQPRLTAHH